MPDRKAIVTYKREKAGTLSELPDTQGTRFVYDDAWRTTIACALPVVTRDHYWRGGLIPFFEHLAPEGWLRGQQARAGGTAQQDDFGLLLQYGADCIGAVGIQPAEDIGEPAHHLHNVVEEAATLPGRTISGVQKKLLAWRDADGFRPCLEQADPATHIAKFNREDLPTLVQNEDLSLRLAREILGQDRITSASLNKLRGIEGIALLVERFDRQDGNLLRLEDFAQILGKPRGREFDGKYNSSYEEAATVIEKYSARARIDLSRFFELVVFNLVIGNADAHLKNFSLLEAPEGLRLSPAYDLLNTLVYTGLDGDAALDIGGRKRAIGSLDRAQVERLGADIGLPLKSVQQSLDRLARAFAGTQALNFPTHVQPDDFRMRYRQIAEENAERILR